MCTSPVTNAGGIVEQPAQEDSDLRVAESGQTLNRCELPVPRLASHGQNALTERVSQVGQHGPSDLRGAIRGRPDSAWRHAVALLIDMVETHLREKGGECPRIPTNADPCIVRRG